MYYVYVLKWKKYYCWSTNDLKRRIQEHRRWKTITTRLLKPDIFVGYFVLDTQLEALELEKKIKRSGHIERWIKNVQFVCVNEGLV